MVANEDDYDDHDCDDGDVVDDDGERANRLLQNNSDI